MEKGKKKKEKKTAMESNNIFNVPACCEGRRR